MQKPAAVWALFLALGVAACGDRGGSDPVTTVVVDGSTTPDDFLRFVNLSADNNSVGYAEAYYRAVDPFSERTTLADYKRTNGFSQASDVIHATFRDQRDLGYGRDMFAWQRPDGCGFAIFVNNYVVQLEAGDASTYGPLNLEAAVNQDSRYLIGTNAIEFTAENPDALRDGSCTSTTIPRIAKFFTFTPPDSGGTQSRRLLANLDGRGNKAVPTACVVCHGATMHPVKHDGTFDPISLKSPKLNVLEVDTLGFSQVQGFSKSQQEANIKRINKLVYDSYLHVQNRTDTTDDQANWHADFSLDMLRNAYRDITAPPAAGADPYNGDYVPPGWQQTTTRPAGVETLYRRVIKPHCIGCHATRGTVVAESVGTPNSVSFSSFERFKNYNDLIIDYVFRRGAMPRSLINYTQFWATDDNGNAELPGLLASFLDGFNIYDTNGRIVAPARAVAIPGGDRVAPSPVTLDASASQLSSSFRWRIVSSTDPGAILADADAPVALLTAANNSSTQIELITANANGDSTPAQFSVLIDNSLNATPNFLDDIAIILGKSATDGGAGCVNCHSPGGPHTGIPVYYDETDRDDLYRRVMARVDLIDPANSLLLRKPTNATIHGGGKQLYSNVSVSDPSDRRGFHYHTILNWIRAGAPCGNPADSMCQ